MNQIIKVTGISNREFLETYALPGRIGLAGGGWSLINKSIARAQRHIDEKKAWSNWSHAFLFQGVRVDQKHWVVESDLEIHRKHIRLGVQENRLEKYFDEGLYGTLAVLDFSLTPAQTQCLLTQALDLVSARTRYSIRELVGTLVALRHPSLRTRTNFLSRPQSFYCSAFVHHLFRTSGLDLAPGLDAKNTTPEDLWRTLAPHTAYMLERPARPSRPRQVLRKLKQIRQRTG
jgi:hypothetical protein